MLDFNDPDSVVYLVGILVPLLVGVLSKSRATSGLKGVLNAVLSAVGGSIVYLVNENGGYDFEGFLNAAFGVFIVSIATYYGVWKPTGVAGTVAESTANFGLGSPPTLETDDKGAE